MFIDVARSLFGGNSVQKSVPVVDLTSDRGRISPFNATLHTAGISFLIRVLQ